MSTSNLIALLALGLGILSYIDEKEHREWLRERDQL